MKFKLIQFATLLAFVMSIVYMAQTPSGFGHEQEGNHTNMDHDPEFWVHKGTGKSLGNQKPDPNEEEPISVDPRLEDHRNYSDSEGEGEKSASSWALRYYASDLLTADGGENEVNMVFGARTDAAASAAECSCRGSVLPTLTDDMGLTTRFNSLAGQAKIELEFLERKNVLVWVPVLGWPPSFRLTRVDLSGSSYDTQFQDIEIEVAMTEIIDKKSGEIAGGIAIGDANVSASYTEGTDIKRTGVVHSYSYGISAVLSGHNFIVEFLMNLSARQSKTATSQGYVGTIKAPKIRAVYTPKR